MELGGALSHVQIAMDALNSNAIVTHDPREISKLY